jgi:hypothetical protein
VQTPPKSHIRRAQNPFAARTFAVLNAVEREPKAALLRRQPHPLRRGFGRVRELFALLRKKVHLNAWRIVPQSLKTGHSAKLCKNRVKLSMVFWYSQLHNRRYEK